MELIARYRNSHETSYVGDLFQRYTHLVYAICLKYLKDEPEAKDAVMQIFEKLLEDLKKYEVVNFKSWLATLTRNFCLMKLRKEKVDINRRIEYENFQKTNMEIGPDAHLNSENNTEVGEAKLKEAIATLKDAQRKCIELFYLQEKSYKEVVELTSYNLKEVKSFIQNGKRNLKIKLSEPNG